MTTGRINQVFYFICFLSSCSFLFLALFFSFFRVSFHFFFRFPFFFLCDKHMTTGRNNQVV